MTGVRKPCPHPGCPALVERGRCPKHARRDTRQRGTRQQQGYGGAWPTIRARVLLEQPGCAGCGRPATTVDHRVPLSRGGTHDRDNLQALCHSCHNRKTAATRRP